MSSLEPQQMLLHYRLVEKIGSGGMGEVYKAEDTKLGRTVAIKLLPAAVNENTTAKRRFLKEAQSASALNHPNIITIHAIEETDGLDFIVMEYIEGQAIDGGGMFEYFEYAPGDRHECHQHGDGIAT